MRTRGPRARASLLAAVLALATGGATATTAAAAPATAAATARATTAAAAPSGCDTRTNDTPAELLECVELAGVREHQAAFQAIADAHGGTRVSGSPGFDDSAEYVMERLADAGWQVTQQFFDLETFVSLTPSVLEQMNPPATDPVPNRVLAYSGSADVTAPVSPPTGDRRGCEASDWGGFPDGNIALVSRGAPAGFAGPCTFALKAENALAAGAAAVVIHNNVAGPLNATLGKAFTADLAVIGVTRDVGAQLAAAGPGLVLRVQTDTLRGTATTSNVLAELPGRNEYNVVMAGAHLDSVNDGPGINDNGSGSAALLEVAENLAAVEPQNTLRFAWWGGEESNLVGSNRYVSSLDPAELSRVALYLNVDMIGSPNHVFFVYDGDDSDQVGAGPGPLGSAHIEKTFEAYFDSRGLPVKGTDFSGRSDYGPFIANGIPSGGLFTGAEDVKTAAEAAAWGGTAGDSYDPCYHQACDVHANTDEVALAESSDALAHAVLSYATSTEAINGR